MTKNRQALLAGASAGIAVLLLPAIAPPVPRLVWNASASAPIGLYRVDPGAPIRPDDMVIAWAPPGWRGFAARRHYLPANVPLVKRVAALDDDLVCAQGSEIFVNGRLVATRRFKDGQGRLLPGWRGCRKLSEGELFLLVDDNPASFDGRYFGVVGPENVVGRASLLWRPQP